MLRHASFASFASFASLFLLAGCSGTSDPGVSSSSSGGSSSGGISSPAASAEADALFGAPSGDATPGSIHGVWGGAQSDSGIAYDIRIRLAPTSVLEAVRCSRGTDSTPTAAVSVKARVSDDEITVLESKTDEKRSGDIYCRAAPRPVSVSKCSGDQPKGFERNCFQLDGMSLVLFGDFPSETLRLTKLSD